jgi:hypothetical protein
VAMGNLEDQNGRASQEGYDLLLEMEMILEW